MLLGTANTRQLATYGSFSLFDLQATMLLAGLVVATMALVMWWLISNYNYSRLDMATSTPNFALKDGTKVSALYSLASLV